jgi:SAM-dependent methyltransferase
MKTKDHWENVYTTKEPRRLGWYKPQLQTSLGWIRETGLVLDASIIDVGTGVSSLVDDLLATGYDNITALDISDAALASLKSRLGDQARTVNWLSGDVTTAELPAGAYDLWHDRAVLHFLTESEDRRKYRGQVLKALKPGGHVIIGVFAPEAPPRCSGLPVHRYDLDAMVEFFGAEFELEHYQKELHVTPGGVEQMYLYCQFGRVDQVAA